MVKRPSRFFRMSEKALASLSDTELREALIRRIYESNLILRSLILRGIEVQVDMVDRAPNAVYPEGYTEIHVQAGDLSFP